ncbi:MAG: GntR family transcriptional regulator [Chitinivibrionales bacterium]|nr:GntR family transcriptional regulator [Chitinivibrionales bacterium]
MPHSQGHRRPGGRRADTYLARRMREATGAQPLLPPMRRMAAECGVSLVTMWRAVQRLKQTGAVSTPSGSGRVLVHGVGVIARAPLAAPPPARPPRPARAFGWQAVRTRLLQDIVARRYPPGTRLPSRKELTNRYGCAHATLRKAVAALIDEGVLRTERRALHVVPASNRTGRSTIVLLCATSRLASLLRDTPWATEIWRSLERECLRHDLRLQVQDVNFPSEAPGRRCGTSRAARHRDIPLGYCLYTMTLNETQLTAGLEWARASGLPVSVLDDSGLAALERFPTDNGRLRYHRATVSPHPGREVARHLLRLGHRRVAYFGTALLPAGRDARYSGLVDAFAEAGVPNAVTPYSLPLGTLCDLAFDELLDRIPRYQRLHDLLQALRDGLGAAFLQRYSSSLRQDDAFPIILRYLTDHFDPMMQNALGDDSVTAWVTYNDPIALVAHSFLRDRDVAMPARLSLVSFDDTVEALANGIASYDFNLRAVVAAMVEHLLRWPRRPSDRPGDSPLVELPGFLVQRDSLGPAPKR